MIKVMICDDLVELVGYYSEIINAQEDMEVVGVAYTGREAAALALQLKPDVVLMDVQLADNHDGIEATHVISEALDDTKVIILTIHDADDAILEAYMAGACDYLLKDASEEKIMETIRSVYETDNYLGKLISDTLRHNVNRWKTKEASLLYILDHISKLTHTERMILKGLCANKNRVKLAEENCISEETVKVHIRHILSKLGFKTTRQMVTELENLGVLIWINRMG